MEGVNSGSYVWGLDGSPGTYITDYVLGGLCSVYGVCILNLYKMTDSLPSKSKEGKKCDELFLENGHYAGKGAKKLLLVLSLTFFICGLMSAMGALIHHFVPLVEPSSDLLETIGYVDVNLDFWGRMRLQLYPWYLVWQLANVSAFLYGILTFLSAIYTIEFDVCLRNAALVLTRASEDVVDGPSHDVQKKDSVFAMLKKGILGSIFGSFVVHFAFRLWRIVEYRRDIFSNVFQHSDDGGEFGLDFHEEKMNLEKFGAIWSATAASIMMMLSFLLNAWIATYLMLNHGSRKMRSTFGDFRCCLIRTVGAWILSLGGFLQLFYAGSCGKNSATECPFHAAFNHNAWYHVLQGVGMTLWFLAEWTYFKKLTNKFWKQS